MSEQNYQRWLRSPSEKPRPRSPTFNTIEVRFNLERLATDQQGDAWLRDRIKWLLELEGRSFEKGRLTVERVDIVD